MRRKRLAVTVVALVMMFSVGMTASCKRSDLQQVKTYLPLIEGGLDFVEGFITQQCDTSASEFCITWREKLLPNEPMVRQWLKDTFDVAVQLVPEDPEERDAAIQKAMRHAMNKMPSKQRRMLLQAAIAEEYSAQERERIKTVLLLR